MTTQRQSTDLLREAAQVVCELMRSAGLPKNKVESELRTALKNAYTPETTIPLRTVSPLSAMASLISRWHVVEKYVDRLGKPRPLSWNGKRGTLLKLATEVNGKENARQVVNDVVKRNLVAKMSDGKWLPKSQVVKPRGLDRQQILRTAVMLRRLLKTISYNSERNYKGDDLLFEVMTRVPRLPAKNLPRFKRFVRTQGMTYVRSVDDWLESRNLPRKRRKARNVREAGVIVFAYEEPTGDP